MKLICKCGNTEKFTVSAREYHSWAVDGSGEFVKDLECSESDKSDNYACAECGNEAVQMTEAEAQRRAEIQDKEVNSVDDILEQDKPENGGLGILEEPLYKCDNCDIEAHPDSLNEAKDMFQRLTVGGIYTDKECVQCGALCFPVTTPEPSNDFELLKDFVIQIGDCKSEDTSDFVANHWDHIEHILESTTTPSPALSDAEAFKQDLKALLVKHKASIDFVFDDCSDMHGVTGEGMAVSFDDNTEHRLTDDYGIEASDL